MVRMIIQLTMEAEKFTNTDNKARDKNRNVFTNEKCFSVSGDSTFRERSCILR